MSLNRFVARLSKSRRITVPKVVIRDLGLRAGVYLFLEIKGVGEDSLEALLAAVEEVRGKVKHER